MSQNHASDSSFVPQNPVQIYIDDWNTSLVDRNNIHFFPDYEGELMEITQDDGTTAVSLGYLVAVHIRFAEGRYHTSAREWHRLLAEFPDYAPHYVRITSASNHFNAGIIDLSINPLSWRYREEAVAETLAWFAGSFLPSIRNH